MKARHVLLISDSCYSGTLFGQARAMPQVIDNKYYLNLYNEKSRWGMTSGNKTPVSDTGSGGHSVFAYHLIKELRKNEKPYISTQEIYTRIAPIVGNNSEQVPICRPIRNTGDQGGEFVFVASSGRAVSVKKSISVKTEPAQLPPEGGVSFDDILKAEEVQRQTKDKWKNLQQAREKDYRKILEIDGSENLTSKQKTVAWQRFLAAVSQDNPYSQRDDKLRSYARSHVSHWDNVKPAKKIEPSSSTSFTDSESEITGRDGTIVDEKPKYASISPEDSKPKPLAFNPNEPWTGTWKVKGTKWGDFVFKLKQSGNKVNSIRGSWYELKAKVKGDRLKGWYEITAGFYMDINLKIAKDSKTFKGTEWRSAHGTSQLKGERQK